MKKTLLIAVTLLLSAGVSAAPAPEGKKHDAPPPARKHVAHPGKKMPPPPPPAPAPAPPERPR